MFKLGTFGFPSLSKKLNAHLRCKESDGCSVFSLASAGVDRVRVHLALLFKGQVTLGE